MESPAYLALCKGDSSVKTGDFRSALRLFDEALRLARKEKNREALALAMQWKGETHRMLGQVNAVLIFSSFLSFSFLASA